MTILDGSSLASHIREQIKTTISQLHSRKPGLAFVLVGDNPASRSYIQMKKKRCAEVGILSLDLELESSVSETALIEHITHLNADPAVDGILIQMPLPSTINALKVIHSIDPDKDVDGFHPMNMGKLLTGEPGGFIPCTPLGIQRLLLHTQMPLLGKHVVIVGRSNIVGKPLAALLSQKNSEANATVTLAHSLSLHLKEICRSADILIACAGVPRLIDASMVKQGAIVIDVGINRIGPSQLVGDVDFDAVAPLCSYITPVPGGVGPMTIALLLCNTLLSYQQRANNKR